jgi:putative copper export protein
MLFVLRDVMRVAHLLAAGTWIGGSVVYLLVIGPALRLAKPAPEVGAQIARLFRQLVNWCIGVLVASGVFLTFDRLTSVEVDVLYVVVLALKVATAITMFLLALYIAQEARRRPDRRGPLWKLAPRYILGLGIVTFLLGATLVQIYESSLLVGR